MTEHPYVSPQHSQNEDYTSQRLYGGLTKRELFAAMSMQGLIAATYSDDKNPPELYASRALHSAIAAIAVSLADALINRLGDK